MINQRRDQFRLWWRRFLGVAATVLIVGGTARVVAQTLMDGGDPGRNVGLACEFLSTPGLAPRTAHGIAHLANVCGFVGTDVEFQSREAQDGLRDYAFLGTMGAGLRIFDITDPAHPVWVGGYLDSGWQNDVQVRGDLAVISFDPISITPAATASACLRSKATSGGGVDIVRLAFDPATATFQTTLVDCIPNPPGGAHNSTLHPSGEWLAMLAPITNGYVDVVDLRGSSPRLAYRIVGHGTATSTTTCPAGASYQCVAITGTDGNWSPHDLAFSEDGSTMYVAAVTDGTFIVDVSQVLDGSAQTVAVVPNFSEPGGLSNSRNIQISHQSDVSADGKILVITDERGGGLNQTSCNTDPNGVIGGMHFWAVGEIDGVPESAGASPQTPKKLGSWFYPNPTLPLDPLEPALETLPRSERACTIHVFRLGGNGTASPGPIMPGFDGVSSLPVRELVSAHYGAGVWHIDFSSPPNSADGIAEDPRATWGNTLGWNIMPGAETWSAKEYKGYIYVGDMVRGFDVYSFTPCDGLGCVIVPTNTPGEASGGGQITGEMAELTILRGTTAGGKASFGFGVSYVTGGVAPTGSLSFTDHALKKKVEATAFDSFVVTGSKATFTGRATVDGVPGVRFYVEVEDLGEPGSADTFRIVLADGYGAAGVLVHGNIQVEGDGLVELP